MAQDTWYSHTCEWILDSWQIWSVTSHLSPIVRSFLTGRTHSQTHLCPELTQRDFVFSKNSKCTFLTNCSWNSTTRYTSFFYLLLFYPNHRRQCILYLSRIRSIYELIIPCCGCVDHRAHEFTFSRRTTKCGKRSRTMNWITLPLAHTQHTHTHNNYHQT